MSVTEISASQFQEMVQAGANRLQVNAEYVNSLNVFPVRAEIPALFCLNCSEDFLSKFQMLSH